MSKRLRFTGQWPPLRYLVEYPNWEYALDEEEIEGQDETTVRPSPQQRCIDQDIAFTAGDARLADGRERAALLAVVAGKPDAIDVFVNDSCTWRIYFSQPDNKWMAYVEHWLPKDGRQLVEASFDDESVFPLTIWSRLPRKVTRTPYHFVIESDGGSKELS